MNLPQVANLTLLEFIKALANAQPGYYRVIVFIVANKPWLRNLEKPTGVEAKKWFDDGLSWLPPSIAEVALRAGLQDHGTGVRIQKGLPKHRRHVSRS